MVFLSKVKEEKEEEFNSLEMGSFQQCAFDTLKEKLSSL